MGDKMREYMNNTKLLLGVIVIACSATAYAFSTFAKLSDTARIEASIDKLYNKMDRIEQCLITGECKK